MAKNSVAVVGKNRLADELYELARSCKLEANLQPDAGRVDGAASLVIETSAGDEEEKKGIVKALDARLPKSLVLLTSCLRFSPTCIASWTARPQRVVGFATFYPINGRKVIELSSGLCTTEESLEEAEGFFRTLGKETVRVKDNPGLTFPRILCLIINEAVRSLDEGVAQAE
ncbi:MAG: 3-hydroxyacyl-CoA dehydrogenase NAD-binding domain-containing protein, partial [Candidatus Binatia bacterium]